ncbi:MAG: DUF1926 domain-containing protein [Candidatus Omnitrophica bacterium]|nr:DUF1926 domain-containing protein [Candidatus Omnitrophota bacterium]
MDKKFNFLIVIHFHQPVGNLGPVIEKACDRCYEPFLDTIAEFPDIRFNLHYSGCLLEWFKQYRPSLLVKIKKLLQAQQIELIGGGFYEPILSGLPSEDGIGQIKMLYEFLKDEFGSSTSGAWLAERVWEPHLAETLSKAGVKYTIIDDAHLRYAGLTQDELYGYYLTEENARCVSIFPSDKILRYLIPFKPPKQAIDYFQKIRDTYKKTCVVYADDGEKFGEWPGTNEWVYKKGWLNKFLKLLSDNSSWLKTPKITDYMAKEEPRGRIYIPAASYQEMSEWALPTESAERFKGILNELKAKGSYDRYVDFIRGGFWRNFFVKYPESNHMHKRMLLVSKRLNKLQAASPKPQAEKLREAKRELFRSQCNCAYWHGVFNGLYLYFLRAAVYKHLISADRILDSIEYKDKPWVEISENDFDCDGHEEFIVNTPKSTFIIDANEGGAITEWDMKYNSLNILNTLSRRREPYHRKLKQLAAESPKGKKPASIHEHHLSGQETASKRLIYDNHRRGLFLEHFLPDGLGLKEVSGNRYQEQGDFINSHYNKVNLEIEKNPYIEIEREGQAGLKEIKVVKRFLFFPDKDSVSVRYEITSLSSGRLHINFAPELNFALTQDDTKKELLSADSLILDDKIENLKIEISFSEKAGKVYRFPIYTISQSEEDIKQNYQASCILPVFSFALNKSESKTITIEAKSVK